jgi:hypothetical protein
MSMLERPWSTPYHPARAFWLLRVLYLLLAADLWLDMTEHGGRYGIGGFNVAHFALLDAWLPVPSAEGYMALLIASGFVAFTLALGPAPRWLRGTLAATYTLAWMLSLHDSYQHHYLISWLLAWAAAVPDVRAEQAKSDVLVRGWGIPMTCITSAIVYFFTGIAKSEPEWRSGQVLRAITHSTPTGAPHPGKFDLARDALVQLGLTDALVWQGFALATIALQWTIALGYLLASERDARPAPWRAALVSLGGLAALSFHGLAELFSVFEIGLFSFYMLLLALILLAPSRALTPLPRAVAWLSARWAGRASSSASGHGAPWLLQLASAGVLAAVGYTIPLPGARAAAWGLAALTLCRLAIALRSPHAGRHRAERTALGTALATMFMWLALTQTSVPFDYYRRTAGELQRMGQLERALSTYRLAERYAPRGRSRAATIREIQRALHRDAQHRRL